MNDVIRIGIDTSKSVFVLHGVDRAEQPVLRRKLRRRQMLEFFAKLAPVQIGIEACGAAHYWARELMALGHEVRLLPPQYVKPYVQRGKNDAADASAICEAMSRPRMRFVPVKTVEQQAALMLVGVRDQLVARRTQVSNMIRGYAAEFGLAAAKGLDKIEPLLARIADEPAGRSQGAVRGAGRGVHCAQAEASQARSGTAVLAPPQRAGPTAGGASDGRSDRVCALNDEGDRSACLPLRPRFGRLDRAHPEGPLHCRQAAARGDHACGR
jgi:Transposase